MAKRVAWQNMVVLSHGSFGEVYKRWVQPEEGDFSFVIDARRDVVSGNRIRSWISIQKWLGLSQLRGGSCYCYSTRLALVVGSDNSRGLMLSDDNIGAPKYNNQDKEKEGGVCFLVK